MIVKVPVIRCSTCGIPWVLRWTIRMMTPGPPEWLYQRDCRHKSADHVYRDDETALLTALDTEPPTPKGI